jgi:N-glycosylase/DNA lyase
VELGVDQPFDLASSLESGQAHRWRRSRSLTEGDWHSGVVQGNLIHIRQTRSTAKGAGGNAVEFRCAPWPEAALVAPLQSYFRLDDDLEGIYGEIRQDARVSAMVERYPGLRLLRQEPWECLIAFICSANSNIPRIQQVMEKMAEHYGPPIALDGQVRHSFPTPQRLAQAGELELRQLGLGFRAPYVAQAARLVAEGALDLAALVHAPYEEAKARLMECSGIGPKIADCVLVFALEKLEAFPIDVWVRRALGEWYFPGQKTPPDRVLLEWAHQHFGRYAGYSQQYLFHGRRLER